MDRFEKQKILPGFGEEGQRKLRHARVIVIGAGGLGCPVLTYLAAAGIGTIGICDGDDVSYSNLNRQVIFGEDDVGKSKAKIAAAYLKGKYSDIHIVEHSYFLDNSNTLNIMSSYDVVVDCSDNFATRYMINDACVLLNKPLILGAIYKYEGHLCVFNLPGNNNVNYRDLYPVPPEANEIPDCSDTGVLGVLPGIIGSMQAAETIKVISGIGEPLAGRILFYDLLRQTFYESRVSYNPEAQKLAPANMEAFLRMDYSLSCKDVEEISWEEAFKLQQSSKGNYAFVDVRDESEVGNAPGIEYLKIPVSLLEERMNKLMEPDGLFLFCKSGVRSVKVLHTLRKTLPGKRIFSIKGGVNSYHPSKT